jgi:hypothetical protein
MKRTHGMSETRVYRIWRAMHWRCNPTSEHNANYSDRGIYVCSKWKDFISFYADMGDAPQGASIDRIDNDKPYSPDNCRWATRTEQSRNRRGSLSVVVNGAKRLLQELSDEYGFKYQTLHARLFIYGWNVDEALSTPAARRGRTYRKLICARHEDEKL